MFSAFTSTTWRVSSRRMRRFSSPCPSTNHQLIIPPLCDSPLKESRGRRQKAVEDKRREEKASDQVLAMALRAVTVLLAVLSTAAFSFAAPFHPIFSSISASPSSLPSFPPAISPAPELLPPSLSPDITPEFPTPGAAGSPSSTDLPTIPSTLSPPNPDDVASPELDLASSPASSPAMSSAVRLVGTGSLRLLVFCFLFIALLLHGKLG